MIALPLLPKPRRGEACNGCGLCCALELCDLAVNLFGEAQSAPCPALEYEGGRAWCGMVRSPAKHMKLKFSLPEEFEYELSTGIEQILHIGKGCGMDDLP